MGQSISTDLTILISAARQLTPEQLDEFRNGRLVVTPAMAEVIGQLHGIRPVVSPPPATPVSPPPASQGEWLKSMDAYDDARAKAESAGASPGTLNALLQPEATHLPCGLTLRPMVLSGWVFLEAVGSPFVSGDREINPSDILLLVLALTVPERVSALVEFDNDFTAIVKDSGKLTVLCREIGGQIGEADFPLITAYGTAQVRLMFYCMQGSEGSSPLGAKAEAAA